MRTVVSRLFPKEELRFFHARFSQVVGQCDVLAPNESTMESLNKSLYNSPQLLKKTLNLLLGAAQRKIML